MACERSLPCEGPHTASDRHREDVSPPTSYTHNLPNATCQPPTHAIFPKPPTCVLIHSGCPYAPTCQQTTQRDLIYKEDFLGCVRDRNDHSLMAWWSKQLRILSPTPSPMHPRRLGLSPAEFLLTAPLPASPLFHWGIHDHLLPGQHTCLLISTQRAAIQAHGSLTGQLALSPSQTLTNPNTFRPRRFSGVQFQLQNCSKFLIPPRKSRVVPTVSIFHLTTYSKETAGIQAEMRLSCKPLSYKPVGTMSEDTQPPRYSRFM